MEEEELDPAVPLVPTGISASSHDEAITLASPSLPDDHKQFPDLLRKVADMLQIPLEEIQEKPHKLLDIVQQDFVG